MERGDPHGIYCNPSTSFDGKGSFHKLGDYDSTLDFVEERIREVNEDEEQGFEAVLNPNHIGRSKNITTTESFHSFHNEESLPDVTLYGKEKLQQIVSDATLNSTNRRDAVFKMLETMGVKTFIVVSGREDNTAEILQRVRDVIDFIAILRRSRARSTPMKCCVLFQDTDGLLYNLVLPLEEGGMQQKWQSNSNEFSGFLAMSSLSLLARVFPCILSGKLVQAQPAFWGFLLSLLAAEEMSLSWLSSSLLVQGVPSTSSYVLINGNGYDWIKKSSIICLVFAGACRDTLQQIICFSGVCLACIALLANMGSRAWHFLQLRKVSFCGPMAPQLAFILSILAGLCFPHMGGCRSIKSGSKVAVESVLRNAFGVSFIFLVSDYGGIQKILLGSTECDQYVVNIAVGSWIGISLLFNLLIAAQQRKPSRAIESQSDMILCEDHCSPGGQRVPTFPDFLIDPNRAKKSISFISLEQEIYCAVFVAMTILGGIVSMAFTGWSKALENSLIEALS